MALLKVSALAFIVLGGFAFLVGWLGVSARVKWLGCLFLHAGEGKSFSCSKVSTDGGMPEQRRLGFTDFWRQKRTKVTLIPDTVISIFELVLILHKLADADKPISIGTPSVHPIICV